MTFIIIQKQKVLSLEQGSQTIDLSVLRNATELGLVKMCQPGRNIEHTTCDPIFFRWQFWSWSFRLNMGFFFVIASWLDTDELAIMLVAIDLLKHSRVRVSVLDIGTFFIHKTFVFRCIRLVMRSNTRLGSCLSMLMSSWCSWPVIESL